MFESRQERTKKWDEIVHLGNESGLVQVQCRDHGGKERVRERCCTAYNAQACRPPLGSARHLQVCTQSHTAKLSHACSPRGVLHHSFRNRAFSEPHSQERTTSWRAVNHLSALLRLAAQGHRPIYFSTPSRDETAQAHHKAASVLNETTGSRTEDPSRQK